MSNYDSTLTMTLPIHLLGIAKQIGKAMDSDVGGYESFNNYLNADYLPAELSSAVYCSCTTPCISEFKDQAYYMVNNPEVLFAVVQGDYSNRWKDDLAPTLDECKLFCEGVILGDPLVKTEVQVVSMQ